MAGDWKKKNFVDVNITDNSLGAMDQSANKRKERNFYSFKPGEVVTADLLNTNFTTLSNADISSAKISWDENTVYPTAFCSDCFSKDYQTKRHAHFIAHGFSLCEDCFRRYCENQKKVYDKSWREANGRA